MPHGSENQNSPLYVFHSKFGFWGAPNYDKVVYYSEFSKSVRVRHDADGIRSSFSKKLPIEKSQAIMFLGGSNTWGAGVENSKTYPAILEEECQTEVRNLGQCSFGLDQISLVLDTYISKINPKYVFVELHPWVIHRIFRRSALGFPKPYFTNEKILRLVELKKIYGFRFFRDVSGKYQEFLKSFNEFSAGINVTKVRNDFEDPIFQIWKQIYYQDMYNLAESIIQRIKKTCMEHDSELIFVLGPTKQEIDNQDNTLGLVDFSLPRKKLLQILDAQEVKYIDLLPEFIELSLNSDKPTLFADGHLNEFGHTIFARELRKVIS
jgi:hypothetical protein